MTFTLLHLFVLWLVCESPVSIKNQDKIRLKWSVRSWSAVSSRFSRLLCVGALWAFYRADKIVLLGERKSSHCSSCIILLLYKQNGCIITRLCTPNPPITTHWCSFLHDDSHVNVWRERRHKHKHTLSFEQITNCYIMNPDVYMENWWFFCGCDTMIVRRFLSLSCCW